VTQKGISDLLGKGRMLSGYASIIPLSGARRIVDAKNGVLLVGDAAGQTKKATGGGIVFGGNAAILAARAVVRNIKEGASLANYEREYHKKFGADLLLHNAVNGLYSSLDASGMEFAIKAMRMLGAEEFLSAYGDMDRPSSIIRRFFTRRGV
jgi:flavin-dependent dehydrogenase